MIKPTCGGREGPIILGSPKNYRTRLVNNAAQASNQKRYSAVTIGGVPW